MKIFSKIFLIMIVFLGFNILDIKALDYTIDFTTTLNNNIKQHNQEATISRFEALKTQYGSSNDKYLFLKGFQYGGSDLSYTRFPSDSEAYILFTLNFLNENQYSLDYNVINGDTNNMYQCNIEQGYCSYNYYNITYHPGFAYLGYNTNNNTLNNFNTNSNFLPLTTLFNSNLPIKIVMGSSFESGDTVDLINGGFLQQLQYGIMYDFNYLLFLEGLGSNTETFFLDNYIEMIPPNNAIGFIINSKDYNNTYIDIYLPFVSKYKDILIHNFNYETKTFSSAFKQPFVLRFGHNYNNIVDLYSFYLYRQYTNNQKMVFYEFLQPLTSNDLSIFYTNDSNIEFIWVYNLTDITYFNPIDNDNDTIIGGWQHLNTYEPITQEYLDSLLDSPLDFLIDLLSDFVSLSSIITQLLLGNSVISFIFTTTVSFYIIKLVLNTIF